MTSKRRQKPARRRRAQKKSIKSNELVLNEFVPSSPIRAAFWARATTALKRIAERADETSLERAVAAPTDAGALARAMSDYSGIGDAVEELDPLAAAIARGAEQKVEILRQGGGALPVSDVAKLLGISRQAVDKRRREGKLLAVPRGADYVYPACVSADGEIVPGLTEILAQFGWPAALLDCAGVSGYSRRSTRSAVRRGGAFTRRRMRPFSSAPRAIPRPFASMPLAVNIGFSTWA